MRHRAIRAAIAAAVAAIGLLGCGEGGKTAATPLEPTRETSCALDGMVLLDYPGPKAQIHYDQGGPDFFCDTLEMFAIYLRPEQKRRVTGIFTQDMGKADWKEPRGHWIDARSAFYVAGSRLAGSMGPTMVSFARQEDAEAFVRRHGGKVFRFAEVTYEMVRLDGGVLRDERM